MKENTLKEYLNGKASAEVLNADIIGTVTITNDKYYNKITYNERDTKFIITTKHIVKIFEDIINQNIKLADLNTIFFELKASDYFMWDTNTEDGNKVQNIISNIIETGKPITMEYIQYCAYYLETGEHR